MEKFNRGMNWGKQVNVQFLRSISEIRDPLLKAGMLSGTVHFISALCARDGGGDRLSGKSSSKNRENYPTGADRKWEK